MMDNQATPDRRESRPLRAQGPGSRGWCQPMGDQVRGDGQEVRRRPEGAGGFPTRDWKHLVWSCVHSVERCISSVTDLSHWWEEEDDRRATGRWQLRVGLVDRLDIAF